MATVNITNIIKEELAGMDIQFYPIVGNHDVWPVNVQDFTYPGTDPSINGYAPSWAGPGWLDVAAMQVFTQYGYYSMPLQLKNGT